MYEPAEAIEAIMDDRHLMFELERRDQLQYLLSLIKLLSPKMQEVAMLFFMQNLTVEEVQERLNVSKRSLLVDKSRVLGRLREMVHSRKNLETNYAGH